MTAPRFHLALDLASRQQYPLPESLVRHISGARRLAVGDALVIFNGQGGEYPATLHHEQGQWTVQLGDHLAIEREAHVDIIVMQALPMGDRMDWIMQKATELGVRHLIPVAARRSIRHLTAKRFAQQQRHWQGIVQASCEQCGRNRLPTIGDLQPFPAALADLPAGGTRLFLSPQGTVRLCDLPQTLATPVIVAIGPEGDWDPQEAALAAQHGFLPLRLGARILRTDTAAAAITAALLARWGDFQ